MKKYNRDYVINKRFLKDELVEVSRVNYKELMKSGKLTHNECVAMVGDTFRHVSRIELDDVFKHRRGKFVVSDYLDYKINARYIDKMCMVRDVLSLISYVHCNESYRIDSFIDALDSTGYHKEDLRLYVSELLLYSNVFDTAPKYIENPNDPSDIILVDIFVLSDCVEYTYDDIKEIRRRRSIVQ